MSEFKADHQIENGKEPTRCSYCGERYEIVQVAHQMRIVNPTNPTDPNMPNMPNILSRNPLLFKMADDLRLAIGSL